MILARGLRPRSEAKKKEGDTSAEDGATFRTRAINRQRPAGWPGPLGSGIAAKGWRDPFDRSYRSAEDISVRTLAADQPGGLPGVLRLTTTRPHLEGGFTLRCFQRLSLPYVATQRCIKRCNWITRGTSNPILSY